jgi:hypothetical protein
MLTAVHVILKGLTRGIERKATNLTHMDNFLSSSDIHLFDDQHRAISWCGTVGQKSQGYLDSMNSKINSG